MVLVRLYGVQEKRRGNGGYTCVALRRFGDAFGQGGRGGGRERSARDVFAWDSILWVKVIASHVLELFLGCFRGGEDRIYARRRIVGECEEAILLWITSKRN